LIFLIEGSSLPIGKNISEEVSTFADEETELCREKSLQSSMLAMDWSYIHLQTATVWAT
jgi:hypothetical protein